MWTAIDEVHQVGAQGAYWGHTFADRLIIASRASLFYAAKALFPVGLSFVYPRWAIDAREVTQWIWPLIVVAGLGISAWGVRRWGRWPLAVLLAFGGVLFPALGFLDVFPHQYSFVADHFQHHALPIILAAIAVVIGRSIGWSGGDGPFESRLNFRAASIASVLVLVCGRLLLRLGRPEEARPALTFASSSSIPKTSTPAQIALVWLWATHPDENVRDGKRALEKAETLLRTYGAEDAPALMLESAAVALRAAGRFEDAARYAALAQARYAEHHRADLARMAQQRQAQLEAGQPIQTAHGLPPWP